MIAFASFLQVSGQFEGFNAEANHHLWLWARSPILDEKSRRALMSKPDHPAREYLRRDLEAFQYRLGRLQGGTLKFGTSVDGQTWTDTTAEEIKLCKAKIGELKNLII